MVSVQERGGNCRQWSLPAPPGPPASTQKSLPESQSAQKSPPESQSTQKSLPESESAQKSPPESDPT